MDFPPDETTLVGTGMGYAQVGARKLRALMIPGGFVADRRDPLRQV